MSDRTLRPFVRNLRLASLVAVGLALSACGFRPMDARNPADPGSPELARIDVPPIDDRVGQVMRSGIVRRLNPSGIVADSAYTLRVKYSESKIGRGIRSDDSAVRNDYVLSVNFSLERRPDGDTPGRTLLNGVTTATTRFNNPDQLYAGFVSERAAQERAADLAADDIARQVRLYFRYPQNYPEVVEPKPAEPVAPTRPTRP
ncbi:putative Predicted secreted protein [uncultured Alphaproteobacteria bacterium]|uniref:Putative Predicted secreted protein n=1 Tax=uncultured Alphaproteobacteria bacterium TaxID=91750 RepID=A0A212KBI1_9PROT|nr:putative Predicted secreted protein [uncultured Alphaproteobacteria bacterium]